jgi:hypothetical protein
MDQTGDSLNELIRWLQRLDVGHRQVSRMLRLALCGAASVLLLVALVESLTGGFQFHVDHLVISATQAGRPAVIACTLLLLVLLIDESAARQRSQFIAVFLGLLLSLISLSGVRRIGDAAEYVAMGVNLARGSPPSLSDI